MSDDRLFATNNPIGRKWYFINIIILIAITIGTNYVLNEHILPSVTSEFYNSIGKLIRYLLNGTFAITLLSLIDRRTYDVFGTRDSGGYKFISAIITIAALLWVFVIYYIHKHPQLFISEELFYNIVMFVSIAFILVVIGLIFPKGKMSNLSYEEYRNKIRYD